MTNPSTQKHPLRVGQILYRYQDQVVACDNWDHPGFIYSLGGHVEVYCIEGRVERLTLKGAHVKFPDYINDRWISASTRKRFAYPTMAEAWDSYQARKRCQCEHLKRQLLRAEAAFALEQPAATAAQELAGQVPPRAISEDDNAFFDDLCFRQG
jgi:hypothetical protein